MQTSHVTVQNATTAVSPTANMTACTTAQMPICTSPGSAKLRRCDELIKAHQNVTADAGREVDFGLEVELDADRQGGALEVAVVVDGAFEEVSCHGGSCN